MNIFYVDKSPVLAAQALCDLHLNKMILETAQLLSTAHRINLESKPELINENLYKSTHVNHPCNKWARASVGNYKWLYNYFWCLGDEFYYRKFKIYDIENDEWVAVGEAKQHSAITKLKHPLWFVPINWMMDDDFYDPPQCMPDEYKQDNTVDAYRAYYISKQYTMKRPMKWTKREKPDWFKEKIDG